MGVFSNRVDRESLKAGDHIYSWRTAYIYAHHGIYVGEDRVIHFTQRGQEVGNGTLVDRLLACSSSARFRVLCLNCTPPDEDHGVVSSCLDCFLAGGVLCRFEYAVTTAFFLAQARGGTCTLAVADPDDVVVHRARYLLTKGFGDYNISKNNCEHFATYCKTGLLVVSRNNWSCGGSGQAASIKLGRFAAVMSIPLRIVTNVPVLVATTAVRYCVDRYAEDIGVRKDVVKVSVEDLTEELAAL
ncbi:uncharacterized protein LOC119999068 [Tripterygium wilfordii]|uniref:uncharacterized protein LOC119999068 n=1 Tax=Tripterygium wilfordii TaxID=458696 RepID=UPI0018F81ADD|nr:uncharacterized protein LOC119999068 [Tripterygium wilfordii]